jgi:hypothetical protein
MPSISRKKSGEGALQKTTTYIGAVAAVLVAIGALEEGVSTVLNHSSVLFQVFGVGHQREPVKFSKPDGFFEKQGDLWLEINDTPRGPIQLASFEEIKVEDEQIVLFDASRDMYLKLPIGGGVATWSHPNPMQWTPLCYVKPVET